MTVRDGGSFVREAIDSLLAQTDEDFEVVVVLDGSTDETESILAGYTDPRIQVHALPPVGRVAAISFAAGAASGDLFAVLDSDDVALPRRLTEQRAYLDSQPGVALIGCRAVEFGGESERVVPTPTGPAVVRRALGMYNPFYFSGVMCRRSAYEECGGFRPEDGEVFDKAFLLRVARRHPVDIHAEPLIRYRRHAAQLTASSDWDVVQRRHSARLQLKAAWQLGLPPHLWGLPLLKWVYARLPPRARPRRVKEAVKLRLLRWAKVLR